MAYKWSRLMVPLILKLGNGRGESSASRSSGFTPEKEARYPLHRGLSGLQSHPGDF